MRVEGGLAPEADLTRALYEQYANQIFRYCLHQLGSREEAEDAVQSTFLNAFRGIKRGVVPELESAWLFKIAHNVCLSRRRTSWRRGRIESPTDFDVVEELTAAPSRRSDELIGLQDVLGQLPENQRRAILLREWQGLSYREIAEELELSQAAVETLIFRARRALATGLEQPPAAKRRVVRGSDLGNILAGLKSLLLGGGAAVKVAATVAVVSASTVVAAAPIQQHRQHSRPAPRPAAPAPKAAAPARETAAPGLAAPSSAVPAKHAVRAHVHRHARPASLAHGASPTAASPVAAVVAAPQDAATEPTAAAPAPVDAGQPTTPASEPAAAPQDTGDAKKDSTPAQTSGPNGTAGTKGASDTGGTKTTAATGGAKSTGDPKAGDSDQHTTSSSSGGSSTATPLPATGAAPVVQTIKTTPQHIQGPAVIPLAPSTAAQYPTAQDPTAQPSAPTQSPGSPSPGSPSPGSPSPGSPSPGSPSPGSPSPGSSGSSQGGGAGTVTPPVVTTPPAVTAPILGSRGTVTQPVISNPGLSISGGPSSTGGTVSGRGAGA